MIYLVMCGRLGNQLFQYSFARQIQSITGQELAIDFTAINNVNKSDWRNYLEEYNVSEYRIVGKNDYFPIQRIVYRLLRMIRPRKDEKKQYIFDEIVSKVLVRYGIIYYESNYQYHKFINIKSRDIIIRGWFESEKYFENISHILKTELIPKNISEKNRRLADKLKHSQSICLTVRRGNFTSENLRDKFLVCTQKYYSSAIEYIKKLYPESIVYVCSDDIEWCRRELNLPDPVIYEPSNEVTEKLYLMSQCEHFVLSNSTFSWWAQYLSFRTGNIVIAPSQWRNSKLPPKDIYSDKWILMDATGKIQKFTK